ncbi:MAG TPA: SCP2 sterol-binding domain-containing protein [Cellvibrio sp.]|jgi:O2-independent ubiquinone biosynthesis accessory factor UbiT|nr:SCP2 sterol-binding domain-containing protein [Cellvibrio sp.]
MSYPQSLNHKVVELTPLALHKLSKYTPKFMLKPVLQSLLNQLFKQQIKAGDLDFIKNKWVRILVTDMDFSFEISMTQHTARPQLIVGFKPKKADVIFSSHSDYLLLLALNKIDPDTLFFQRKLRIQGDTELGLYIKNLLASLDLTQQLPLQLSKWINRLADSVYEKKC